MQCIYYCGVSGYNSPATKHSLGVVCVCACMCVCLLICLSVCVPALPACIHVNTDLTVYIHLYIGYARLSAYLFAYLPVCMRAWLSAYLYAFQHLSDLLHPMSVYRLHIYLYACLLVCLFTSQCAYLFLCLPVRLSVSLYASPTPSPQNHTIKIQNSFLFHKAHDHVYLLSQHVERGTATPPTLQPIHHRQRHSAT